MSESLLVDSAIHPTPNYRLERAAVIRSALVVIDTLIRSAPVFASPLCDRITA